MNLKSKMVHVGTAMTVSVIMAACAHHDIKPVDISATANPTQEMTSLSADLESAKAQRLDVLAPENYEKARQSYKEAQNRQEKGRDSDKVLESVAYGRAYLNRAQEVATKSQAELADVVAARDLSIKGGAHTFKNELSNLDDRLMRYTKRIEDGRSINRKDLTELQADYLNLELKSIKSARLSEAQNTLLSAEKEGARRLTPQSYNQAKEKLATAEKMIETDRHNEQVVNQATQEASQAAKYALTMVQTAKGAKNQSPEEVAAGITRQNAELAQTGAQLSAAEMEAQQRQKALSKQSDELGRVQGENQELQRSFASEQEFQKAFEAARAEFKSNEADVYRQGNNLIVRLKAMNFASGRSDLPAASVSVLSKVKEVIKDMKAQAVVVEGHTDATGAADVNRRLSEERAQAVATYFTADADLAKDRVDAVGYGFEKPIASNKTKEGRSQNRRVDVVIKTSRQPVDTTTGTTHTDQPADQ